MTSVHSLLTLSPVGTIYVLDLGLPISFNRYKDRRQHTTQKGRIWRDETITRVIHQCGGYPEPLVGRSAIYYELWMPDDNIRRDIDNFTGKHVLDVLVKAKVLSDDNTGFVVEEHKFYRGKNGKGALIVTAMEI